ncbi:hypothetical protein A7A76_21420 [Lysobacter enzymogenes]|uniref:hypothetical protein n=1 Tax=Lysobacter enzymogenes TaxID=69 RepID=UPI0019CFDB84|nr:hypothetical protein [Lysobacter enzymogenes]MBN7137283.1 hypothetical protein [Lysobacter enzymogenes]
MPTALAENRSPAFVPLALSTLVFVLSGAFVLVAALSSPAAQGAGLNAAQWLCSIGSLIGFVAALACVLTDRRGVPARPWACILAALVLIFGLGVAWSLLQTPLMQSLAQRSGAQALGAWAAGLGALKVVAVNLVALPLAWWLGGRGTLPVAWTSRQRRAIGALVALSLGAGVALLVQTAAAAFTALGEGEQRAGMSVVGLAVGVVHGLTASIAPVRRGSGALPALWSSLLTPALIVLASLPAMLGGEHWELATRVIAVALALLLAPVASWLLVRWLHGRSART